MDTLLIFKDPEVNGSVLCAELYLLTARGSQLKVKQPIHVNDFKHGNASDKVSYNDQTVEEEPPINSKSYNTLWPLTHCGQKGGLILHLFRR